MTLNKDLKDLISLFFYAFLSIVLNHFSIYVNIYFRTYFCAINLYRWLAVHDLCEERKVLMIERSLKKQLSWIETTEPFRFPFEIMMRCILVVVLFLCIPFCVCLLLSMIGNGEPNYQFAILLGVSISTIFFYVNPWMFILFANIVTPLYIYDDKKNLTANGVLLKYLINAKNVNFFVYFFYFCFLAYTSAASCFNIFLISKESDIALKGAFIIHIAFVNMMAKAKDIDINNERTFKNLFGSVLYASNKK